MKKSTFFFFVSLFSIISVLVWGCYRIQQFNNLSNKHGINNAASVQEKSKNGDFQGTAIQDSIDSPRAKRYTYPDKEYEVLVERDRATASIRRDVGSRVGQFYLYPNMRDTVVFDSGFTGLEVHFNAPAYSRWDTIKLFSTDRFHERARQNLSKSFDEQHLSGFSMLSDTISSYVPVKWVLGCKGFRDIKVDFWYGLLNPIPGQYSNYFLEIKDIEKLHGMMQNTFFQASVDAGSFNFMTVGASNKKTLLMVVEGKVNNVFLNLPVSSGVWDLGKWDVEEMEINTTYGVQVTAAPKLAFKGKGLAIDHILLLTKPKYTQM